MKCIRKPAAIAAASPSILPLHAAPARNVRRSTLMASVSFALSSLILGASVFAPQAAWAQATTADEPQPDATNASPLSSQPSLTVNAVTGINVLANQPVFYDGPIGGPGPLFKFGEGTLGLNGPVTLTGRINVALGTLALNGNNLGLTGGINVGLVVNGGTTPGLLRLGQNSSAGGAANTITVDAGGIRYANGITMATPIILNAPVTQFDVRSGTATQTGAISEVGGARSIEKTSSGTLSLAGISSFTGDVLITEGTLAFGANGLRDQTKVIIGSDATTSQARLRVDGFRFLGSVASGGTGNLSILELADNSTLQLRGPIATTFAGRITGNGSMVSAVDALGRPSGGITLTGISDDFTGSIIAGVGGSVAITGEGQVGALRVGSLGGGGGSFSTDGGALASNALLYAVGNVTFSGSESIGSIAEGFSRGTIRLEGAGTVLTLTGLANPFYTTGLSLSDGVISGEGGLTVTGGEHLLNRRNTFTGSTIVTGGKLTISGQGGIASSTIFIGADGSLLTVGGGLSSNVAISNSGLFTTFGNETIGSIDGLGSLVLGGILTTGGLNTDSTIGGTVTGAGGLIKAGLGTLTINGRLNLVGGVTVNGGTLALNGANLIRGGVTVAGGTLRLASNNAAGGASGRITTIGSVIDYANGVNIFTPITLNSNSTQLNVSVGTAIQSGIISETGGARPLEKIGAGTLTMSPLNEFTGPLTITEGTVQMAAEPDFFSGLTRIVVGSAGTVNNATLRLLGSDAIWSLASGTGVASDKLLLDLGSSRLLVWGGLTSSVYSGRMVGTEQSSITLQSLRTGLELTGDGSGFTGALIALGRESNLSITGAGVTGAVTLGAALGATFSTDGGALADYAKLAVFGEMVFTGSETVGTIANGFGTGPASGTIALVGDTTTLTLTGKPSAFNLDGFSALAGSITGTGNLAITGGVHTLTGTNSYSGTTMVNGGSLVLNDAGTLVSLDIRTSGEGILRTDGGALSSLAAISNAGLLWVGAETVGSVFGRGGIILDGTLTTGGLNRDDTISGNITGSGGLIKTGTGTLTLSGQNGFSGPLIISEGTVQLDRGRALGNSVNVIVGSSTPAGASATLRVRAVETIGTLSSGADPSAVNLLVDIGNRALFITGAGARPYAGRVSSTDGGAIVVTQGGNLELTGDSREFVGFLRVTGPSSLLAVTGAGITNAASIMADEGGTFTTDGGALSDSAKLVAVGQMTFAGSETVGTIADLAGTGSVGGFISLIGDTTTLTLTGKPSTFNVDGFSALAGSINGNGNLAIAGGLHTLSGVNSFTGRTTVTGGTLALTGAGSLASTLVSIGAAGTLISDGDAINDIAQLDVAGRFTLTGAETIGQLSGTGLITLDRATLALAGARSNIFSGSIQGTGGLSLVDGSQLALRGVNSYTGLTTLDGGSLILSNGQAIADSGAIIVNAGALTLLSSETIGSLAGSGGFVNLFTGFGNNRLTIGGDESTSYAGFIFDSSRVNTATLEKAGLGTLSLTGSVVGNVNVLVSGGTLVLSGDNRGIGTITVGNGTLRLASNLAAGAQFGRIITTGSVIDYADGVAIGTPITLASNSTQLNVSSGLAVQGGPISEDGTSRQLHKTGAGALFLLGTNSYTGGTLITGGVLQALNTRALGADDFANAVTIDGGTLRALFGLRIYGTIGAAGGTIQVDSGPFNMQSHNTVLNGVLNKTGNGTLYLFGTAVGTQDINLLGGHLILDQALSMGGGRLAMATGTQFSLAKDGRVQNQIVLGAGGSGIHSFGNGEFAGDISGGALTVNSLLNTPAGVLTLTGNNSYSGGTTIARGVLQIGNGGTTGNLGAGDVVNNATLLFNRSNAYSFDGNIAGTGLIAQMGSGTTTLNGAISTSNDLLVLGGTLVLTGVNTYTGSTIVSPGTLSVTGNGSLASTLIEVSQGSTFNTDGDAMAAGALVRSAGTVTMTGAERFATLEQLGGVVNGTGPITVTSYVQAAGATGGSVVINSDSFVQGGNALLAAGTTVNAATSAILNGGTIAGTLGGAGPVTVQGGATTLTGTINGATTVASTLLVNGGRIVGATTNNGAVLITSGAFNGGLTNNAIVSAQGTMSGNIVNTARATFFTSGALTGGGNFANAGSLIVSTGNYTGLGAITNSGTVGIDVGRTLAGTSYAQSAGTTTLLGTLAAATVAINGGALDVSNGRIQGNLTNAGNFTTFGNSSISGNFANSGTSVFNIGFDTQSVGGTFAQNGGTTTLNINYNATLNTSGRLTIGGVASGNTLVAIGTTGTVLQFSATPTVMVQTGGGSGTFTQTGPLLPANALVSYTFGQLNANQWGISANFNHAPLAAVTAGLGALRTGILTGFYQPVSQTLAMFDQATGGRGISLWARTGQGRYDANSRATTAFNTSLGDTTNRMHGFEGGVDATLASSDALSLRAGIMGGHVDASDATVMTNAAFLGRSLGSIKANVSYAGLYGVVRAGGFTLDVDYRHEWQDYTVSAVAGGTAVISNASADGRADVVTSRLSYQFTGLGRAYVRPLAGLNWYNGRIDPLAFSVANVGSIAMDFEKSELLMANLGMEAGINLDFSEGATATPYIGSTVWINLSETGVANVNVANQRTAITVDDSNNFGELRMGMRFAPKDGTGFGADFGGRARFGGGVTGYSINASIQYRF